MVKTLVDPKNKEKEVGGKITISGREEKPGKPSENICFRPVVGLKHAIKEKTITPKKDKIFLVIKCQEEDGQYVPVLKTECQKKLKDDSYHFNYVKTNSLILSNGDDEASVVFEAYKFNDKGAAKKLASWNVKYRDIKEDKANNIRVNDTEETLLGL